MQERQLQESKPVVKPPTEHKDAAKVESKQTREPPLLKSKMEVTVEEKESAPAHLPTPKGFELPE